ncbi:sulfatase-like hydrolase/transferase [bacterium]
MTPQNIKADKSNRFGSAFVSGLLSGIIIGLVLFFADLYLGLLFIKISPRTYIGVLAAYIFTSACIGIVINLLYAFRQKSITDKTIFYRWTFIGVLFFVNFVYINTKLTGMFFSFAPRSLILNFLLLAGIIAFAIFTNKNSHTKNILSNFIGLTTISLLIFHLTAQFNYFYMDWPFPPRSKILTVLIGVFILFIPFIAAFIMKGLSRLFKTFKMSEKVQPMGIFLVTLLLILVIPLILQHPNMNTYHETKYEPTDSQLANLREKPNLIWIVLDTARKDRFSCYGNDRETTPNIDALAKDGVRFEKYISTSPWTTPSHASMFTGMFASKHGCHHSANDPFPRPLAYENVTIAEILHDHGMNTGAVISNFSMSKNSQLHQGFHFYYCQTSRILNLFWGLVTKHSDTFNAIYRSGILRLNHFQLGSEINQTVYDWLDGNANSPMFLFINYMEPHEGAEYIPGSYGSRYDFTWDRWNKLWKNGVDIEAVIHKKQNMTPEQLQVRYDWVDCKLSYLDAQIGKLFDKLKEMDLYDNTMIVLVSDHGDLLGEHNSFNHTTDLYNELIWVPLIIKYPKNMDKKGVVEDYVQTVDIMPEVLTVMDIPIPEEVQGQPISEADHSIISELYRCNYRTMNLLNRERYFRDMKSIISKKDGLKYIQSTKENDSELFNIIRDPREQQNLITKMPGKATQLDKNLNTWFRSFEPVSMDTTKTKKLDKDLKQKLKSLGYIK